jgi:hypothetical protein
MVIASGEGNGKKFIILGLSKINILRMDEGKPIILERATHGDSIPDGLIITIFTGETEYEMKAHLEMTGLVTKQTLIHIDPRLKHP